MFTYARSIITYSSPPRKHLKQWPCKRQCSFFIFNLTNTYRAPTCTKYYNTKINKTQSCPQNNMGREGRHKHHKNKEMKQKQRKGKVPCMKITTLNVWNHFTGIRPSASESYSVTGRIDSGHVCWAQTDDNSTKIWAGEKASCEGWYELGLCIIHTHLSRICLLTFFFTHIEQTMNCQMLVLNDCGGFFAFKLISLFLLIKMYFRGENSKSR